MRARIGEILSRNILPSWIDRAASIAVLLSLGWITSTQVKAFLIARRNGRVFWDDWFAAAFWVTCFLAALVVMLVRYAIRSRRQRILWADDHGVCGRCGYALQNLPTNRCPECGTYFLMRRKLQSPNAAARDIRLQ